MKPVVRNTLAVIGGFLVGSAINMCLVTVGGILIPPPAGADVNTMEGLKAAMPLFEGKHFLFPYLAHAIGTLAGAAAAAALGASRKLMLALIVGALFLAGGIVAVFMLPSPMWFNVLDLFGAYIPMAVLGARLATWKRKETL